MKMTDEVLKAIETLKSAVENDFERLAIERLETALTNPPRVEVVDDNHQRFNGLTFYKDKKRGYYYTSIGVHQAVWRYYCGDIPFDFNIHHVNENKADNDIENLQIKSRSEHAYEHGQRSDKKTFTCVVCGKEFEASPRSCRDNPCCSTRCRAQKNRKPFKDVKEVRQCIVCGKSFLTSKYRDAQTCSPHCTALLARQSRREGTSKQKYSERTESRQCVVCGNTFITRAIHKTKCCSQKCAGIMRSKAWKEAQKQNDEKHLQPVTFGDVARINSTRPENESGGTGD